MKKITKLNEDASIEDAIYKLIEQNKVLMIHNQEFMKTNQELMAHNESLMNALRNLYEQLKEFKDNNVH